MKRISIYIIFLCLIHCNFQVSEAQDINRSNPVEMVRMFTDRSLYIAGENIYFSAALFSQNSIQSDDLSKILYVEIIDHRNFHFLGKKFLVANSICTGVLEIPGSLPTGIYYVKSYTKYLRNSGPEYYRYNQITIVNPFEETLAVKQAEEVNPRSGYTVESHDTDFEGFHIQPDKSTYRQSDLISISILPEIHPETIISACISVIPAHAGMQKTIEFSVPETPPAEIQFIPEYYGLTLTGLLRDSATHQPIPSGKLDLTILGKNGDFIPAYTDIDGRFLIPLPEFTGQKNLYIGTPGADTVKPSILIDNDFCGRSVNIPNQAISLSEVETAVALDLARNFQVYSHFADMDSVQARDQENTEQYPFYGLPTETLNLEDYIMLPILEDYFNELPYFARVRNNQGKKSIKILGNSSGINIFQPLVLLDMVAIYDIENIVSMPSVHFSHIDMINETYVRGRVTYGGILSIFSKKNDFAGIDLPESGVFLAYDFQSPEVSIFGGIEGDENQIGNVRAEDNKWPDARNTLYWNGNLKIDKDTPTEISFMSGNSKGDYTIKVRGVLQNGETFSQSASFRVE